MIRKYTPYIFFIYIILLLIGDILPGVQVKQKVEILMFNFRLDHWLHFFSYFGLTILFILFKYSKLEDFRKNSPFLQCWQLFIFAAGTEFLQMIVPGRSGNFKDFLSNSIGIIFGMIAIYFFKVLIVWFNTRKLNSYKEKLKPSVVNEK
jgi:VanZ family protein